MFEGSARHGRTRCQLPLDDAAVGARREKSDAVWQEGNGFLIFPMSYARRYPLSVANLMPYVMEFDR